MGGELRDEEVSAAVQIWGKSPPGRRKNKCKGPDVGTMRIKEETSQNAWSR